MGIIRSYLSISIATTCYLLLCFSPITAIAEEPGPINTERPSFSASPLVLPTGLWQIETGYQFTHDEDEVSLEEHTLPNALLRFGFYETMELQISNVSYKWKESDGRDTDGLQDMGLGVKWQINDSDSVVPIGLLGSVSLPVGSSEFTSDDFAPSVNLLWTHSGWFEWFGAAVLKYSDELFTFDNAIGISFSLWGNTGAYVEYLVNFYEDDNEGTAHNLNLGAKWLLSDDLQLDLNGGVGLNSNANDYFMGVGLSYRFR